MQKKRTRWGWLAAFAALVAAVVFGGWGVLAGTAVVAYVLCGTEWAQRRRFEARRRRQRQWREERLVALCASTLDLAELTDLVDRCVARDGRDVFDLDGLLDRYGEAAVARHRCRGALALGCSKRGDSEVHARRIAQTEEVWRVAHELDESLAEIAELVRYYAARAAEPELAPIADEDLVARVVERYDAA
jgi:hypothetical protein